MDVEEGTRRLRTQGQEDVTSVLVVEIYVYFEKKKGRSSRQFCYIDYPQTTFTNLYHSAP